MKNFSLRDSRCLVLQATSLDTSCKKEDFPFLFLFKQHTNQWEVLGNSLAPSNLGQNNDFLTHKSPPSCGSELQQQGQMVGNLEMEKTICGFIWKRFEKKQVVAANLASNSFKLEASTLTISHTKRINNSLKLTFPFSLENSF